MKKIFLLLLSILMTLTLIGCSSDKPSEDRNKDKEEKLSIVTTIFPEYDWVRNIIGDNQENIELTLLLENGTDVHSYQPTAADMLKIANCDLFIYVGGESDEWVASALKQSVNPDLITINLLEVLGDKAREEEIIEGMEHEHDHEEEHDNEEHDEHVWLSLRNAEIFVREIAAVMADMDPVNSAAYLSNSAAYIADLQKLDSEYTAAIKAASKDVLLFGDRFPFLYLVEDYDLDYYAAFAGCSAETEASFQTIIFLADKVNELGLNSIMTIDGSNQKIAGTIRDNTTTKNQQILTLNSLQSVSSKDIAAGKTYLSIMQENLEVLKEALK